MASFNTIGPIGFFSGKGLCFLRRRTHCRLYLPRKPVLTFSSLGGDEDYAELGSKFKACQVKIMLWWLAFKSQKVADARQDDSG